MVRVRPTDGEPVAIPLQTAAGRLVLDVSPGDAGAPDAAAVLAHGGSIEFVAALAPWGEQQPARPKRSQMVIPRAEPGAYALCRVSPTEIPVVWAGALPPERCRVGSLSEGETLERALP